MFMFIVHCSHGATLIFDDLFITIVMIRTLITLIKVAKLLEEGRLREGVVLVNYRFLAISSVLVVLANYRFY